MNTRLFAAVALTFVFFAGSTSAHHNMSAIFDFNNRVALKGTLSKVHWTNPHIQLIVDAKEGNKVATWSFEGPSPGFFRTRDVGKADFAAAIGRELTIDASRARDGSLSALLRLITLPDGKVVSLCPQNC